MELNLEFYQNFSVSHNKRIKKQKLQSCTILKMKHFVCICVGLQHEGIFRVSGSQVEVNDIKNAFERGTAIIQRET